MSDVFLTGVLQMSVGVKVSLFGVDCILYWEYTQGVWRLFKWCLENDAW